MPQFLLSPAQIHTALHHARLTAVPGSPLEDLGQAILPPDDGGCVQLSAHRLMTWSDGTWKVNRAFALFLAVAAVPEETVWIDIGNGAARMTLCRRGTIAVECSPRPDGLLKWVFPQVWAILPEMLADAFRSAPPASESSNAMRFRFEGTAEEAFLLSIILQADREAIPCRLESLQTLVDAALANPGHTLPFLATGCGEALQSLLPGGRRVSSAAMKLLADGLVNVEDGNLRPVAAVAEVFMQAKAGAAATFRRRLYSPRGFVTAETTGMRCAGHLLTWSLEPQPQADPLCRWRLLAPATFKDEVLRVLGCPANPTPPADHR